MVEWQRVVPWQLLHLRQRGLIGTPVVHLLRSCVISLDFSQDLVECKGVLVEACGTPQLLDCLRVI